MSKSVKISSLSPLSMTETLLKLHAQKASVLKRALLDKQLRPFLENKGNVYVVKQDAQDEVSFYIQHLQQLWQEKKHPILNAQGTS